MPKYAARIFLEITSIRIERVQDITAEDALAEGIKYELNKGIGGETCYDDAVGERIGEYRWLNPVPPFHLLWDSINKKRGYGWDMNPWNWVIEFKKEIQ